MDAGFIRGTGTAILLLCFLALCMWAWAPAQRRRFDEASRLPFLGDDGEAPAGDPGRPAR